MKIRQALPILALTFGALQATTASAITGNPLVDGWTYGGHSLDQGAYVHGSANIGFDMYSTQFTVSDSSQFSLAGHSGGFEDYYVDPNTNLRTWDTDKARIWGVGDTVIGIGGMFSDITATEAGWGAFTGDAVNSNIYNENRLRLQAKIGTADADWSASTLAPDAGDGSGSFSNVNSNGGLGSLFVRTSGWHDLSTWESQARTIFGLQDPGHILRNGTTVGVDAARVIWTWDAANQRPGSWQLLVNLSLVHADGFLDFDLLPDFGNSVIGSVQVVNGAYTDGLMTVGGYATGYPLAQVPVPAAVWLFGTGLMALAGVARRKHQNQA
ncbi:MAG: VPLPA-CTERM sorting domain-containing protein [Gammaproteobacteria bacterium]|nr:VPLPA-CTERM sorting domain-containing protein [Gammaproteobacteria bacterium]